MVVVQAAIPNCPPMLAESAAGEVYRCAKACPPAPQDMETAEEQDRLHHAEPCLRRALSVFRSYEDAQHQVLLFRGWQRRYVVHATLMAQHGRTLTTRGSQPTHTSWWPSERLTLADRCSLFTEGEEVQL